ncbi:MAG: nucleoside-triphosphatase [Dehalococcoidales bacterium]
MNLLILGKPGSGKTSWCSEYISWLRRQGLSIGGVLCPETRKHGEQAGFNAIDLLTGEEIPFARLSRDRFFKEGERVGDYTISRKGILFACSAIEKAVENRCDLVIIDEVGPLELRGKGLMPATELALASMVNVLIIVRSSLREALQRHFPKYEFTVIADLSQFPPSVSKRAKWLLPLARHLAANCTRER